MSVNIRNRQKCCTGSCDLSRCSGGWWPRPAERSEVGATRFGLPVQRRRKTNRAFSSRSPTVYVLRTHAFTQTHPKPNFRIKTPCHRQGQRTSSMNRCHEDRFIMLYAYDRLLAGMAMRATTLTVGVRKSTYMTILIKQL